MNYKLSGGPLLLPSLAALASLLGLHSPALAAPKPPDFHAEVAPILRDYCAGCHSGKEKEGELNLETFAALKTGGENGCPLPKNAGEPSLLQKVIQGGKPAMPPKKEPQPTKEELAILEAWLKAGAPGPAAPDVSILSLVTVPDLPLQKKISPAITTAALSPDGRSLAVGRFQAVEILDATSREVRHRFEGFEGKVTAVAFSPSGQVAAASGLPGIHGRIRIWNPASTQPPVEIPEAHRDAIYTLRWSPDGQTLASGGYDFAIRLWNPHSGEPVRSLTGHNGAIFDLAFHPSGTLLASASADQTVKIWRLRDGERLDTLKEPQGEQFRVAFTPDGNHVVSAGADRRIRLWKLLSRDKAEINPVLESRFAHESAITQLVLLERGRLLSIAQDRSAKLWTLPQLELDHVLPNQPETVTGALPDPNTPASLHLTRMDGSIAQLQLPPPAAHPQTRALSQAPPPPSSPAPPLTQEPERIAELEPNEEVRQAQPLTLPTEVRGSISRPGDSDVFRFQAQQGERLTFEVFAGREKSTLDSRLEILDESGRRVERTLLQATRSSWLTFRGKDSNTSDDFRVQNYAEMELNEFLYCNGEVVKLWMYPRGPDSGFIVYPGLGNRHTYFGTPALSHPLGEPVYTVRPLPPGSTPPATGLPLFPIYWENDDDPLREAGRDSLLHFVAPRAGHYAVRVSDTRGFGGDSFGYRMIARATQPDFSIQLSLGGSLRVSPGSGAEFQLKALRKDDFEGPIEVHLENLPPGFRASGPIVIEAGQTFAYGAVYADAGATLPPSAAEQIEWVGRASVAGFERVHRGRAFREFKLGAAPKLTAQVLPPAPTDDPSSPVEIVVHPGETVSAKIRVHRTDFKDRVEFGKEDSGRNLPHGVYVDNLGLNGLLIPEGEQEREFFLTAAKWAPESTRWIFFRAKHDGGQATPPVRLRVVRR